MKNSKLYVFHRFLMGGGGGNTSFNEVFHITASNKLQVEVCINSLLFYQMPLQSPIPQLCRQPNLCGETHTNPRTHTHIHWPCFEPLCLPSDRRKKVQLTPGRPRTGVKGQGWRPGERGGGWGEGWSLGQGSETTASPWRWRPLVQCSQNRVYISPPKRCLTKICMTFTFDNLFYMNCSKRYFV